MKKIILFFSLCLCVFITKAQFTSADSLRGQMGVYRVNYDVTYYHLALSIDPDNQSISGSNTIHFKALDDLKIIQLDLFENLSIDSVIFDGHPLWLKRNGNAFFVHFPSEIRTGSRKIVTIYYSGKPLIAKKAPWDGGFVWRKDDAGKHWASVACEGLGASAWWPNKDHLSDEPDSMALTFTVPSDLTCVSNGTLISVVPHEDSTISYNWKVHYPINNYNVTFYLGDYVEFDDIYSTSENKSIQLNYYVLRPNLEKGKEHFMQVNEMLQIFEELYGAFPFPKDGYALVEAPYWGMEHQGAIAYGNRFQNNLFGFDYIIIHESGHEYFGNSISVSDIADLWVHESFTTYTEALYVEKKYGYDSSLIYLANQRPDISNIEPIQGPLGVNYHNRKDADMYYKGSWMLHTLRNVINDDDKWFALLKKMHQTYQLQVVDGYTIKAFMSKELGLNLDKFFEQYLETTKIPVFTYKIKVKKSGYQVFYKWDNVVEGFDMPIKTIEPQHLIPLNPTTEWQKVIIEEGAIDDFYIPQSLYLIDIKKVD